ncbi:MAG: hypothetical protein FWE11_02110 [Defluviitaleaceae bacterium]|nr:hypothetical protein [Defluviitaleaceae bacterium]
MTYHELKKDFLSPSSQHRSLPFWAWNDALLVDELVRQIHSMKEQGIGGFFMHSREGLETDYLSEEWFDLVKACVDAAKEAGMEAWLYDEDRWPSGTAGGRVTRDGGDDSRCKGLTMEVSQVFPQDIEKHLAIYKASVDGHQLNYFQRLDKCEPLVENEVYLICRIEVSGPSEWFNDESPPDNLNPQSVKRFIEITHEAYKAKVGDEFGKTVKGIFADEPGLHDTHTTFDPNRGWIPWTYIFKDYFTQKRGYDLLDYVPLIFFDGDESASARHDYWRTVTELYVESFSMQISLWCEENNIDFTGHFLQENRIGLSARVGGAVMPHYVYQHIPGIDLLMEQTKEYLTVRQCTSVANQYSRPWVLTETYGCTGWHFTFEGQKWLGDWQYVQGVTRRCQHLALYSIKGCRKRDYPPVFNYNTSWWKYNHVVEDYFARLSAVLGRGRPVRDILILHPATTAWALLGTSPYGTPRRRDERDIPGIDAYGYKLNAMLKYLMGMHYDFDLGDELIMAQEASVCDGVFRIKEGAYKTIIIPEIETMLRSTYLLLMDFLNAGGHVISLVPFALMLEGRKSPELSKLYGHENLIAVESFTEVDQALEGLECRHISIQDERGNECHDIYCMLKETDSLRTLFVVNNNRNQGHSIKIKIPSLWREGYEKAQGLTLYEYDVEEWDMLSGEVYAAEYSQGEIATSFGPAESKMYVLKSGKVNNSAKPNLAKIKPPNMSLCTTLPSTFTFRRDLPNSLTLDMCAYRIGDTAFSDVMQLWQAQRDIRDALGMRQIYYNGLAQRYKWANVPHPNDGAKVELKFQFYVEHIPEGGISLAIESPEHFKIYLNAVKAETADANNYFIDKSIGVVRLNGIQVGINTLLIACEYKNSYELEDCYILGDFGVDVDRRITKEPKKLRLGDWCLQGLMHYAGAVIYESAVEIKADHEARYFIDVGSFLATVIAVKVNGQLAGYIPWKCANILEITKFIWDGINNFELEVMGSPRNLFGPFHVKEGEPDNTSWSSFRTEADNYTPDYNLQPYGLNDIIKIMKVAD